MNELPTALYDAAGTRALDEAAIAELGIDGYELMRRAGHDAYQVLCRRWPDAHRLAIVCGPGNNGGDGYVVAELAARDGKTVRLWSIRSPRSDAARAARRDAEAVGVPIVPTRGEALERCDLVIDALLGTGLSRAPEGDTADAIRSMNEADAPVFSLDLPSGLVADTGAVPGVVVEAAGTSTFIGLKLGLLTGRGPEVAGVVHFHDLGAPSSAYDVVRPVATRIGGVRVRGWLPRRRRCAHKGDHGHVVLVGGNDGMTGALAIAARAAARSGAGLVTAATRARNTTDVNRHQDEIMTAAVDDASALETVLSGRRAFAIGPGLGRDGWAASLVERAVSMAIPCVVDADALNLLAGSGARRDDWVLTPHPGEAARLLDISTAEVAGNRPGAVREIVRRYGGVCVLKGCGTLVGDCETLYLCDAGNPGMGTGGMGDCLTGVITGLLGQGLSPLTAAASATWLHATAGDHEARANGMIGMLATDLLPWVRRLMEPVDE